MCLYLRGFQISISRSCRSLSGRQNSIAWTSLVTSDFRYPRGSIPWPSIHSAGWWAFVMHPFRGLDSQDRPHRPHSEARISATNQESAEDSSELRGKLAEDLWMNHSKSLFCLWALSPSAKPKTGYHICTCLLDFPVNSLPKCNRNQKDHHSLPSCHFPLHFIHKVKIRLFESMHPHITIFSSGRISNSLWVSSNGVQWAKVTFDSSYFILENLVVESSFKFPLSCRRSRDIHGGLSTSQDDKVFLGGEGGSVEGCVGDVGLQYWKITGWNELQKVSRWLRESHDRRTLADLSLLAVMK